MTSIRDRLQKIEWSTVGVAVLIYIGWGMATWFHSQLPWPVLAGAGAWLVAWHNSLQHECIHGHPTASRRLNTLIALPPLSLWLPFEAYRQSHLAHHATQHLTDPEHDPESRYAQAGPGLARQLARIASRLQSSLAGRLALGPVTDIARFLASEGLQLAKGDTARLRMWAGHLVAVGAVAVWLHYGCHMSLVQYLACFVYPGGALSLLRSFAEHRADSDPGKRVAVVERAPVLGLLFLNNNLHAVHHARPGASWRQLPRLYASDREHWLQANGGLVYDGYADVFRRFLWRSHDDAAFAGAVEAVA